MALYKKYYFIVYLVLGSYVMGWARSSFFPVGLPFPCLVDRNRSDPVSSLVRGQSNV